MSENSKALSGFTPWTKYYGKMERDKNAVFIKQGKYYVCKVYGHETSWDKLEQPPLNLQPMIDAVAKAEGAK